MDKKIIKQLVWKHQYARWQTWRSDDLKEPPSLRRLYPLTPVTLNTLPPYLHHDHPYTAAHRARLRFCRARLLEYECRFKFKDAPRSNHCVHCTRNETESVSHVITTCTHYTDERWKMRRDLDRALPHTSRWHTIPEIKDFEATIIAPEMYLDTTSHNNKTRTNTRAIHITGKFIDKIQSMRKY